MSVFDMDHIQFKKALADKTTPELVYLNANNIYDFLSILFGENCTDSVLREWAFQWWSEETNKNYDEIYNQWLNKEIDYDLTKD